MLNWIKSLSNLIYLFFSKVSILIFTYYNSHEVIFLSLPQSIQTWSRDQIWLSQTKTLRMFGVAVINKSYINLLHRNYFEIRTHKCKVTSSVLIRAYQYMIYKYVLTISVMLSAFMFISKAVTITILIAICFQIFIITLCCQIDYYRIGWFL